MGTIDFKEFFWVPRRLWLTGRENGAPSRFLVARSDAWRKAARETQGGQGTLGL